ncbi:MAG TPA: hypothetical protein VGR35_13990 [Tepidisphaeraceae bacterium]|nr:hypothetical protein [Tepidisphaeraceae bacterium]
MPFASGSITFRRFLVMGKSPSTIYQELLDKLAAHALKERDLGVPDDEEYGWSGGRHVLDGTFSFEQNVFADALHFGLRIDTNKVPAELKKAYTIMEEDAVAATNPSGFISKNQKRDVKDIVKQKLEEDLRSGRFRRSKLIPILWDLPSQTVYCAAGGAALEKLMELFERTFDLSLLPLSAGSLALKLLEPKGRRRDYEDLRPTRFVYGPEGESQHPEYPWVAKGPEPKDFIGNEFLLWLWHELEVRNGTIKTEGAGELSILIDRALDLDCAYGQTGEDTLRGDSPTRMPEARDALRSGKLPRKAGMILEQAGNQYSLTFNPETFGCNSGKLPDVEEAETPRVLFEERITLLRDLCGALDGLFATFLKHRASSAWEGQTGNLRRWIMQTAKPVAAVA